MDWKQETEGAVLRNGMAGYIWQWDRIGSNGEQAEQEAKD
jgi:hypothetical protein